MKKSSVDENLVIRLLNSEGWDPVGAKVFPQSLDTLVKRLVENGTETCSFPLFHLVQSPDAAVLGVNHLISMLESWQSSIDTKEDEEQTRFSRNVYECAKRIPVPRSSKFKDTLFDYKNAHKSLKKQMTKQHYETHFSDLWTSIVKLKMDEKTLRSILTWIPDQVMPRVTNAALFVDFFVRCFQLGDPYNVLALNGIFRLINDHNLDYPEFYTQVYGLIHPSICSLKQKKKFFELINLFLSSTHLPSYLVAAFLKKLSRMLLFTPMDMALPVLQLVKNIMIRHQTAVGKLIDRDSPDSLEKDPFDMDDSNLATCNAIQSSLWEIKSLQNHWFWKVGRSARFINSALPPAEEEMEWPDENKIWQEEISLQEFKVDRNKPIPINFTLSDGLFSELPCPGFCL